METLQNGSESLHTELGSTKIRVQSPEVSGGAETTGALGSQEIMAIKSPLVLGQIDTFHGPLLEEGRNLFPQLLSFV